MDKQLTIESSPSTPVAPEQVMPAGEVMQTAINVSPATAEMVAQAETADKTELEKVRTEIEELDPVTAEDVSTEMEEPVNEQEESLLEPGFNTIEAQMAFYRFMEISKVYKKDEKEAQEFTQALDEVMDRQFEMSISRQFSVLGTLVHIVFEHMASKTLDSTFGIVKETVMQNGAFDFNDKKSIIAS